MGNLIRMQLHADRFVVFAGYRIPHPLENKMVVKVWCASTPATHLLDTVKAGYRQGWEGCSWHHYNQQGMYPKENSATFGSIMLHCSAEPI